jgi:hypothetical protein
LHYFPRLFRRKLIGRSRRSGRSKASSTHEQEHEQKHSTAVHISGSLDSGDNVAVYVTIFYPITGNLRTPAHWLPQKDTHVPLYHIFRLFTFHVSRFQWPRGINRGFAVARLLGLWVRIPPKAWMFVACECCVLSDKGLYDGLITSPEESYECGVSECDREASTVRMPWSTRGCCGMQYFKRLLITNTLHRVK